MTSMVTDQTAGKNRRVGAIVAMVAAGMVGLAFAAVPLYELFCQVTGYGGTTQKADANYAGVLDRDIQVRFIANAERALQWEFKPVQNTQQVKVGEQVIAYYEAYNPTDKAVVGTATFNVTPHKAGEYFAKIDCFCFTEQILQPGERVKMPVVYFVDPEMDKDRNLDEVKEIALSYTFFVMEDEEENGTAQGR